MNHRKWQFVSSHASPDGASSVDLLQFLTQQSKVGRKPIDALFERRPDLQFIKLTCENTNTPLPYVDLVNEILETYVALDGTTVDLSDEKTLGQMVVKDTSPDATADELSANPAYINEKAYDKLKQVVYPFTLPYNRPLEIVRTYLEQLGSSRYEVMKTFQKNDNITSTLNPSDTEIAYEYLKISPEERDILVNGPLFSTRSLWEFYGYTKNYFIVNVSPPPNTGPSDLGGVGIEPIFKRKSWEEYIAHVPEFLQQTGLSYPDLIELVQTRFIKITRETREGYDPCDLNNVTIKNRDGPSLFVDVRKRHAENAMTACERTPVADALSCTVQQREDRFIPPGGGCVN